MMMRKDQKNASGGNYRCWSLALPSWATPPPAPRRRSSGRIRRLPIRRIGSDGRSAVPDR